MPRRNFYVLWVMRSFRGALAAIGFRDRGEIMRGLLLWAVTVLALWYIPWEQWPIVSTHNPGAGDQVRFGLCAIVAIVIVGGGCLVWQLLVQPPRIYSEALNHIDEAERVITLVADNEGDRRFLSEAYTEGMCLYRAPIVDNDPDSLARYKSDMNAWVSKVRAHIQQRWSITALHEFNDLGSKGGMTYRRGPNEDTFDRKYPDEHGFSIFCTYSAYLKSVSELVRYGDHLGDAEAVMARYAGEKLNIL